MAHKNWEKWLKIATLLLVTTTIIADFTTECQRPCDCRWQSGNKAAICSNSSLKIVPANLSSDIQILDLSNNHLQQLHHEAFKRVGLSNLKKLFLRDSNIEIVQKSAFVTLAIMIELDLSKNKIRYLHSETFRGTEKLRLINLSNNFIDKLEDGLFRNLKFLQKVEVSNNKITRIGTKAFVNLPQLKILRIDGNSLSHMKPETLMGLRNLSGLDLHNNPWRCDCNLQTFRDWVISHNLYTPPTSCAEPATIRSKLWNELDSSNFACRPTILEPLPDSTIKSYDENVTLICKVVGNPTPEVFWRYNGRTIEMRSFGEVRYSVTENTMDLIRWVNLTILSARYSDRGNYTCVAENPGGRDEKTLTLALSKYSGIGTIIGLDADSFAIAVGCLITIVIIFGAVLSVCYFTAQKSDLKRLIKTDTRSSNGDALIEASVASETEKVSKTDINPVAKPPRKYDTPSLTNTATEMSELNKTLLDSDSVLALNGNHSHQEFELPKITKETLIGSQENQAYPPDLLSFPPRSTNQISPASAASSGHEKIHINQKIEPKIDSYGVLPTTPTVYNKGQSINLPNNPLANTKGYVTLPRRPRSSYPENNLGLNVYSTLNGVIPYYDSFNMKLFGNYYSLNKSEMDIGPISKSSFIDVSDDLEPAPSPAPGTPHATIPRNSLSSPNIHNQLLLLQAMSHGRKTFEQRPLTVTLGESDFLLRTSSKELKGYHVGSSAAKSRTIVNAQKLKKRHSSDLKEQLIHSIERATQV